MKDAAGTVKNLLLGASLMLAFQQGSAATGDDPLPSWNDTAPKKAIVAFVEKVTKEGVGCSFFRHHTNVPKARINQPNANPEGVS
jgi:hypothetical protein